MKFLYEPCGTVWVAAQNEQWTTKDVRTRLLTSDICLSDLDGTDVFSPAMMVARHAIGTSYFSPSYLGWGLGTLISMIGLGKESYYDRWVQYKHAFLADSFSTDELRRFLTPERVKSLVFPGVADFYRLFPAPCIYVTQNMLELAGFYLRLFDFKGVIETGKCKADVVEAFVGDFSRLQRYFVKGDSDVDFEMLDVLRYCVRRKKIESVVGCYVAARPMEEAMDTRFDVIIGQNYTGLVKILKEG